MTCLEGRLVESYENTKKEYLYIGHEYDIIQTMAFCVSPSFAPL